MKDSAFLPFGRPSAHAVCGLPVQSSRPQSPSGAARTGYLIAPLGRRAHTTAVPRALAFLLASLCLSNANADCEWHPFVSLLLDPTPDNSDEIVLTLTSICYPGDVVYHGLEVDVDGPVVNLVDPRLWLTPGGFFFPQPGPQTHIVQPLPPGDYQFRVFDIDSASLEHVLAFETSLTVQGELPGTMNHETPRANETVSGVNVLRGWSCDGDAFSYQVDSGPLIPLAAKLNRPDTLNDCGDVDNGYAGIVNWNEYSTGIHNLRIYRGSGAVAIERFIVVSPGTSFVTDVERSITVHDFPEIGDAATLEWSPPQQRFLLKHFQPGTGGVTP